MININNINNEQQDFLNLQEQHYNMAAIIGRSWKYQEIKRKKGRKNSVCLFDTNKFFDLTKEEKQLYNGKSYFDIISDKQIRDKKIRDNISSHPDDSEGENRTVQGIFTSLLLTPETEKVLNIEMIEVKFLSLLEKSNDLTDVDVIQLEENINIIKDYLALQFIRTPIFYRFLLNEYFKYKIYKYNDKSIKREYRVGYPAFFKEFSLLDTPRIKEFIKYAQGWYIVQYKEAREKLEDYDFLIYKGIDINLHLGDITTFYFNFKQYGLKEEEIQKIVDYNNNKDFLNNLLYSPITPHSFLCAFPKKYNNITNIKSKLNELILPIIKKGLHNQIIFIYSKYIICPPVYKDIMEKDLIDFFTMNDPEYIYKCREEEISYIIMLEKVFKHLKTYESLYKKIEIPK